MNWFSNNYTEVGTAEIWLPLWKGDHYTEVITVRDSTVATISVTKCKRLTQTLREQASYNPGGMPQSYQFRGASLQGW